MNKDKVINAATAPKINGIIAISANVVLKIIRLLAKAVISLIAIFMLVIQVASWLKIDPPASALLTLPKMLVTWFVWQIGIISLLLLAAAAGWALSARRKNKHRPLAAIIALIFILSSINSFFIAYRMRNAEVLCSPDIKMAIGSKNTDYNGSIKHLDATEDLKKVVPETQYLQLSIPDNGIHKDICFLYLNYGNWRVDANPETFSYLERHMNSKGYSYAVFGGRSRDDTDIAGLVKDIRKTVDFLKTSSTGYGIKKIVISGGSAGGHLALITAFSNHIPEYEIKGAPDSFGIPDGVAAFYPPIDLVSDYYTFTGKGDRDLSIFDELGNKLYSGFGGGEYPSIKACHIDSMNTLLGGNPDGARHMYEIASVNKIASDKTMPVYLMHGTHDSNSPPEPEKIWAKEAIANGMNITWLQIPNAEHVFDLAMPDLSPAVSRVLEVMDAWLKVNFN